MNKRIISFIYAGLGAISCVSSLCFYDYFANDGTTSNLIYWIFDFFQLSILLGQAGIGVYAINALLRQRKEAVSSLGYFAAHVFLQNITPLLQAWSAAVITEYPLWLLISQVIFSIVLLIASLIIQPASLFRKSEHIPRLLMAAFYINCVYTALTIIGLIITL
mgnify:FL=1